VIGEIDAVYAMEELLVDDSAGNASGSADPGEQGVELTIPLRNEGFSFGSPFEATLVSDFPTVTVTRATTQYGVAFAGEVAEQDEPFRLNVSPSHNCGDPLGLRLLLAVPNRP